VGSFRQKRKSRDWENGVWEAGGGFWGACGGFVWFLRDVAMRRRVVRVLRGLQKGRRVQGCGFMDRWGRGMGAKGAAVNEARHRIPLFWFPSAVRFLDEFVRSKGWDFGCGFRPRRPRHRPTVSTTAIDIVVSLVPAFSVRGRRKLDLQLAQSAFPLSSSSLHEGTLPAHQNSARRPLHAP